MTEPDIAIFPTGIAKFPKAEILLGGSKYQFFCLGLLKRKLAIARL
jgi:hypothetical protein